MRKRLIRYETLMWRTGRKVGRTIYAVIGDQADDHDPLIGVMDTRALAEAAVRAHNKAVTFNPDAAATAIKKILDHQRREPPLPG